MQHTVMAYISRLSTEKLETFLQQYATGELKEDYTYIIPYLQAELSHRQTRTQSENNS